MQHIYKMMQKYPEREEQSRPPGRGCLLTHVEVKHVPTHSIFLRVCGGTDDLIGAPRLRQHGLPHELPHWELPS